MINQGKRSYIDFMKKTNIYPVIYLNSGSYSSSLTNFLHRGVPLYAVQTYSGKKEGNDAGSSAESSGDPSAKNCKTFWFRKNAVKYVKKLMGEMRDSSEFSSENLMNLQKKQYNRNHNTRYRKFEVPVVIKLTEDQPNKISESRKNPRGFIRSVNNYFSLVSGDYDPESPFKQTINGLEGEEPAVIIDRGDFFEDIVDRTIQGRYRPFVPPE